MILDAYESPTPGRGSACCTGDRLKRGGEGRTDHDVVTGGFGAGGTVEELPEWPRCAGIVPRERACCPPGPPGLGPGSLAGF